MPKLAWYWHRFRVMSPTEMALQARKKLRQFSDAQRQPEWQRWEMDSTGKFPTLPDPSKAPEGLRAGLKQDVEEILAGRWRAFGHLELRVDDPPRWHKDYLVNADLATGESAFKLNHRALPDGADIKLIWELSRWNQLVRLAMAAYVLGDERAAGKCVEWLEDWVKHNPPYRGWNWTSALEAGMRLIQFTWIDALLSASAGRRAGDPLPTRLSALGKEILAPHARFVWRHQSFGSSANNHLIGELAGLIVAQARWPELRRWSTPLETLQFLWQREVLAQFAEDGGNREQALNYHLFSWEFCWQAAAALHSTGCNTSSDVTERLYRAADFFVKLQVEHNPWDYGDSDNAFVTPFFASETTVTQEWRQWLISQLQSPAIDYWLGGTRQDFREELTQSNKSYAGSLRKPLRPESVSLPRKDPSVAWALFRSSGQAVCRSGLWMLRWDLSPLGYLRTAAHGHLDALHLSIWYDGTAIVVDPGTGAYFVDQRLRSWLASREAHNAPAPVGTIRPKRLGPFLWVGHHPEPSITERDNEMLGTVNWGYLRLTRCVKARADGLAWIIEDACGPAGITPREFLVRWQFAPGAWVKLLGERKFSIHRDDVAVQIEVDENWAEVELVEKNGDFDPCLHPAGESLEGLVSPAFRKLRWAPFLKLTARAGDKPCVFRTTFLASPRS